MSNHGNVANLLGLARTAMVGGNQSEALTYFNRVLELDPSCSEAWIGKGKAAGWQSTMANIRLNESLIAFNHGVATAPEEHKDAVTKEAVEEINKIVAALYALARQHLEEFASLDNTWVAYLGQVSQMLEALEQARTWDPLNRTTLDNIVHLCKDNIEGYSYRDFHNMPAAHGISESYEALLRQRMNEAVEAIRSIDASYSAPQVEKKTADACFVVTASMGNPDHPDVVLLRRFRDDWIRERTWGEGFIVTYYRVGPKLAAVIERSEALKRVSRLMIVAPAVRIARRKLDMKDLGD